MSDFEGEIIHGLMKNTKNIRNMSVIAHVDHGKSTLTDCLLIKAKISGRESNGARYMDTRDDEKERGITIKATAVSMHFNMNSEILEAYTDKDKVSGTEFLINLIDSPGHVDFSSEVTAALRVTDGALVVVDCVDGICVQTETVLRQAVDEMIVPTLVLNKLDRAILELHQSPEELYRSLRGRVDNFNGKLQEIIGDRKAPKDVLDPGNNDVSFCSGLQGWGFTLSRFARFFLKKNGKHTFESEKRLSEVLWNPKYYCTTDDMFDPEFKLQKASGGVIPAGKRSAFEVIVLAPIYKVRDMCMTGDVEGIIKYLANFDVDFKNVELTGTGKPLFKIVFKTWLPAAEVLLEQIVTKLPSPIDSQAFRAKHLYTGPTTDPVYEAIAKCDTSDEAPISIYISKMVPDNSNGFVAFGRILSGNIKPGMKVFVQNPDYVPDATSTKKNPNVAEKSVTKVLIVNPRGCISITNCPAGNIVGLVGVESFLKKTGTITNVKNSYNIKTMKFSVSPVVKVSVYPAKSSDLSHFKEGLEKLAKSDPLCLIEYDDFGQPTIGCAGELHMEIILSDLKKFAKCDFIVDKPQVKYYEGFAGCVDSPKLKKSANKHNKVWMTCEPLDTVIVDSINQVIGKDSKEIAAKFREVLNIDDDWVKRIMYFGPEVEPLNILVDDTKGIQYMLEVKEHLFEGFKHATKEGPMLGESLRGGRFNLIDLGLHADSIHRGANQMIRPVEDLVRGLVLAAQPILYEPIFNYTVSVPNEFATDCESVLKNKRATIDEWNVESNITNMIGTLPVNESFGISMRLKEAAKGLPLLSFVFSHYAPCPGSLDKPTSVMATVVAEARKRKKSITTKLDPAEYFDVL